MPKCIKHKGIIRYEGIWENEFPWPYATQFHSLASPIIFSVILWKLRRLEEDGQRLDLAGLGGGLARESVQSEESLQVRLERQVMECWVRTHNYNLIINVRKIATWIIWKGGGCMAKRRVYVSVTILQKVDTKRDRIKISETQHLEKGKNKYSSKKCRIPLGLLPGRTDSHYPFQGHVVLSGSGWLLYPK